MPRRSKSAKVTYRSKRTGAMREKRRKPTKRQLVSARAGIVETKKKVNEPTLPLQYNELTAEYNIMIPDAWEKHTQGHKDNQVIGSSIFMKFLTAKFHFDLNTADIVKVPIPVDLRFIIGWCKLPQNIPPQDEAVVGPPAMERDVVYNYNPEQHIGNYLKHSIDNPLEGVDRSVFKVDRDFRVSGMPRTAVQGLVAAGYVPQYTRKNIYISHTWRPMRKLKLEPVTSAADGNATHFSPCNKAGQWIPFVAVINQNYQSFPGQTIDDPSRCPQYITKSTAYFTDS